ncbi:hypothetical protein ILYODFUR_024235 [Ilyodon furcidens]|uniref:Uncharacterized protein n=1 Tax=Ilyodon furcidens TaxID=33524 RepID=A0ABV0SPM3_9TELE
MEFARYGRSCMCRISPGTPLPPTVQKHHIRLIGFIKIDLRRDSVCVKGGLSCVVLCCSVKDWQPVQGVPASRPMTPTCFKLLHNFISGLSAFLLGLQGAICSLMLSNKPEASRNGWIYTEIKLHTDGLY